MSIKASDTFVAVKQLTNTNTMTIYDASKSNQRPPDSEIEVGITIISRATMELDFGHGEWAVVPCCDRRIHLKCLFKEYTEQYVLDYVEKHWGRGWIVQSHNICIEDKFHPF